MAANKPRAVAKRASAIPGATIARLVFLDIAIDWNEFIIPHTVPNKPIKGAVDPIVAPGIAEALFATALGLLAAIPAVVAYNKFNSDSQRYFSKIDNFSKRFLSII